MKTNLKTLVEIISGTTNLEGVKNIQRWAAAELRRKHGVWFEEAQSVFDDPSARLFLDRSHLLSAIANCSSLFQRIRFEHRIISARKATEKEGKTYEERI